jgi:flagellar hook assembly protein FlgD
LEYFIKEASKGALVIKVKNEEGDIIKTFEVKEADAGFGSVTWNGKTDTNDSFVQKGKYEVEYQYGKEKVTENLEVK